MGTSLQVGELDKDNGILGEGEGERVNEDCNLRSDR